MMNDEQYYAQLLEELDNGLLDSPEVEHVDTQADPHGGLRVLLEATGASSFEEMVHIAVGRPRAEEANARSTWRVRATDELDRRLTDRAQHEKMPKSALIRKAVDYYLVNA